MPTGRDWKRWLYWGAWVLLGLFMFSQDAVAWDRPLRPRDTAALVGLNVAQNLVWGTLSLLTLRICRRFPLHHRPPAIHWLGHLAASVLVVVSGLLLCGVMSFLVDPPKLPVAETLLKFVAWYVTFHYLIYYWGVVGLHEGIRILESHQREEIQVSLLEARLAEARLQAVRAQLNPHFLFNALNTLSAVLYSDPGLADRLLVKLSQFLRTSLEQRREDLVTLGRELGYLQDYLDIEQLRFGTGRQGIHVSVAIPDGLQDALVPPFLLQPLVENAIKHGHPGGPEGLSIRIQARQEGQVLALDIVDDGRGDHGPAPAGTGLGLRSTRLRLDELFGAGHAFELRFPPEGGAAARIRIPLRRLENARPAEEAQPACGLFAAAP